MIRENKGQEKLCLFFASDYHFEMITLPYINKNLNKNKKIIVVTENNLDKTIEKVLSRINLEDEERNKLIRLDWKNNDINKLEEIKKADNEKRDTIVFVKGKEDYIDNINKNIGNFIKNGSITIIDCFDINEVQDDIFNITQKYDKILSTSGVEKLLK